VPATAERRTSLKPLPPREESGDGKRAPSDLWRSLGISGDILGTSGATRRTLRYSWGIAAATVGAVNAINVITEQHNERHHQFAGPLIWEVSSWLTVMLFFWIPWLGWRMAPPSIRPRWKLLVHIPVAFAFSITHVGGFVLLRKLAYWLAGDHYVFGSFLPQFFYEFRKDAFGYALFFACFTLVDHLLNQPPVTTTAKPSPIFDIRDGAKLTRVRLDDILAVSSAGNYVEFAIRDGRRLLMRSPLSVLERELAPHGFLRTHRSWLVNANHVTALRPEGSGDYAVQVQGLTVPLSRRFPAALAKLRHE
jgi:hypothetical protein